MKLGYKIYKKDYDDLTDIAVEMQSYCIKNHYCLEDGEDENGYYLKICQHEIQYDLESNYDNCVSILKDYISEALLIGEDDLINEIREEYHNIKELYHNKKILTLKKRCKYCLRVIEECKC